MSHKSGYGTIVPVHLGNTDRLKKNIKPLPQGRAGTRQLSVLRKFAVTNIVAVPTLLKLGRSH